MESPPNLPAYSATMAIPFPSKVKSTLHPHLSIGWFKKVSNSILLVWRNYKRIIISRNRFVRWKKNKKGVKGSVNRNWEWIRKAKKVWVKRNPIARICKPLQSNPIIVQSTSYPQNIHHHSNQSQSTNKESPYKNPQKQYKNNYSNKNSLQKLIQNKNCIQSLIQKQKPTHQEAITISINFPISWTRI